MHVLTPVEIAVGQPEHHGFGSGDIGRDRDVVTVADTGDRKDVGFIRTVEDRVVEEDHKVKIVALYHIDKLLIAADASGKEFMDFQVRYFLDPAPGHLGGIQFMFCQDIFICKAEIFDQVLLTVVCDKTDIHNYTSCPWKLKVIIVKMV